jgi:hypothetical protein
MVNDSIYGIFTPRNYGNKDISFGLTYQLISYKFYFTYFKGYRVEIKKRLSSYILVGREYAILSIHIYRNFLYQRL